ncbi:hypothetical protein RCO48_13385 [Peribacillus frigoritolerans]|nr:hypothetical protein [Peribacillus frigoritolerans]
MRTLPGRSPFFHYGKSKAMAEAVHHIQMMNKKCHEKGGCWMNRCLVCDEGMKQALTWRSLLKQAEARAICEGCEGKLNRITGETCTMCSRELGGDPMTGDLCLDCSGWERNREWGGYLSKNISLFHYNEYLKDLIAKYKYRGGLCVS